MNHTTAADRLRQRVTEVIGIAPLAVEREIRNIFRVHFRGSLHPGRVAALRASGLVIGGHHGSVVTVHVPYCWLDAPVEAEIVGFLTDEQVGQLYLSVRDILRADLGETDRWHAVLDAIAAYSQGQVAGKGVAA